MPTNVRDPRTIITPDAFELARELLGIPLANPWRRLVAMLLDLLIIAILSAFLESIELFVWGTAGLFVLWVAFQRPERTSPAVGILLRLSAGCLGLTILATVLVVTLDDAADSDAPAGRDDPAAASAPAAPQAGREEPDRGSEGDRGTQEAAAAPGAPPTGDAGVGDAEVGDAGVGDAEVRDAEVGDPEAGGMEGLPDPAGMSDAAVLAELAARLDPGPPPADSVAAFARYRALLDRAAPLVAAATIESLRERGDDLRDDVENLREDRAELERALARERGDLTSLLADIWDQAGSAIGIWSLYFTLLLTLWDGRTVGKRAMGLRVLRLDGRRMGWWEAFERAGGYVAGLATGLLGFVQLFWDPNRQCIHDKIVGTVVVRDGAEPIHGGWQEAAGAAPGWTPGRGAARVGADGSGNGDPAREDEEG